MASAIEDVRKLPGDALCDQDGNKIGTFKNVYAMGEGEEPMWATVEMSPGIGQSRMVFVPVARLKAEADEVRVPYSGQHLLGSPEIEPAEELSEEHERALRDYYGIDLADQEVRTDNESYAAQVPDVDGSAKRVEGES